MSGVIFGQRAVAQIRSTVKKVSRLHPTQVERGRHNGGSVDRLRIALIGTLEAPASTAGAPTTCTVAVLQYSVADNRLIDSGRRLTIHNFDESLSGEDGTYGKIEFLCGVWEIYWLSCAVSEEFEELPEEGF